MLRHAGRLKPASALDPGTPGGPMSKAHCIPPVRAKSVSRSFLTPRGHDANPIFSTA
jgi:hypothetical protein